MEEAALAKGVSKEEYAQFISYVGGFYGNMSNYHSFGDFKFVPEVGSTTFKAILTSNPLYNEPESQYRDIFEEIWPLVEVEVFAIDKPFTQLGFPDEGGVTGYLSRNMTKGDCDVVRQICVKEGIDLLNTRAVKRYQFGHEA